MSGSRVGGNTGDMTNITTVAQRTADLAGDSGARTRQAATRLNTEIGEAGQAFRTTFGELGESFKATAAESDARLEAANWEGQSRETALRASRDFRTAVDRVVTQADESAQDFEARTKTKAEALNEAIGTQFARIMTEAAAQFSQYGQAVGRFRTRLEDIDASTTYS